MLLVIRLMRPRRKLRSCHSKDRQIPHYFFVILTVASTNITT